MQVLPKMPGRGIVSDFVNRRSRFDALSFRGNR